jgi:microcystin-dependent protein
MAQPYVGEIRIFAGNFPPSGWMFCDGAPLPIAENDVLFQLIGTTYGGDGQATFNLPDLRGRVPLHMGTGPDGTTYTIGEMAGVEQVTLTTQQIPVHNHAFIASLDTGTGNNPGGNVICQMSGAILEYKAASPGLPMAPQSIVPVGGSQPHENLQPILGINFIISLFGIFPSQT